MIPVNEPLMAKNALKYVSECIKTGWISSAGSYINRFEEKFADYLGVKYAITTTSGTTALHLGLASLGIGHEDEVIIPALTMIAIPYAVLYTGAFPVLVDVDPEIFNINPGKIIEFIDKKCRYNPHAKKHAKKLIDKKTNRVVKTIMPVQLYGHPCNMDEIMEIAENYNLYVVEDAAEAHGALYFTKRLKTKIKFRKHSTRKFLRAFLFSVSLLTCLNLLFMYVIYLENMDLRGKIFRPNFGTLINFYKKTQLNYADVHNHMLLIKHGYTKIDTKTKKVDFGKEHINWAYPPLHPTLARLINVIIKSPFWSLWIINQIVLLSIFVGFYYWSKAYIRGKEMRLSAWLILLFFILSPLCYFINFMILPGILLGIIFFALRKWLNSPQEHRTAFWILVISSFLVGFSRFQGMLLNASLLIFLFIIIVWYKKSLGIKKAVILFLANIFPMVITMGIFKYYANDPFAWAKIQAAWGVSFSWPWTAIIRYWKSGLVFNLFSDDLFFTSFRLLVFFTFICLATKIIIFNKNFIQNFILRRYGDSFINLYFIAISFGLLILPLLQGVLLAAHRLMTLAFLTILIWFEQDRRRISIFIILFLIVVRAVEFTLFFQGVRAFIW